MDNNNISSIVLKTIFLGTLLLAPLTVLISLKIIGPLFSNILGPSFLPFMMFIPALINGAIVFFALKVMLSARLMPSIITVIASWPIAIFWGYLSGFMLFG